MIPWIPRRLDQFVHDVVRGRQVGIPHSEVDDVFASGAGLDLQLIDNAKDVGRQPLDPFELLHGLPFRRSTNRRSWNI